jgi:hypothetical protein
MNAKKLGKFKIETENKGENADNIVTKQVGIRTKMYGRELELDQGGYEYKVVEKGVPQRKKIHNFFEDILFNETQNFVEFNRIDSRKLDIYTDRAQSRYHFSSLL